MKTLRGARSGAFAQLRGASHRAVAGMGAAIIGLGMVGVGAVSTASATTGGGNQGGGAQVCPSGDGWYKTDLRGEQYSFTHAAPAGYQITEVCAKSAAFLPLFQAVLPSPVSSYTFTSQAAGFGKHAISHVSVKKVKITTPTQPAPTPTETTPTKTPKPTPTKTPKPTPTKTPPVTTPPATTPPASAKKVVVCKYVTKPSGVFHHIIIVSEATITKLGFNGTFPFSWTDAHGQTGSGSKAVRYATPGEKAKDVSVAECGSTPPGPTPTTTPTKTPKPTPTKTPKPTPTKTHPGPTPTKTPEPTPTKTHPGPTPTTTPTTTPPVTTPPATTPPVTSPPVTNPTQSTPPATTPPTVLPSESTAPPTDGPEETPDESTPPGNPDEPNRPGPQNEPTVLGSEAAVPTSVDAGLIGSDGGMDSGLLIMMLGTLLAVTGAVFGFAPAPRRGKYHH